MAISINHTVPPPVLPTYCCHRRNSSVTVRSISTQTITPLISDPPPSFTSVTVFAPATIANLGPGFDFLGCAASSPSSLLGDTVTLSLSSSLRPAHLNISSISPPTLKLPKNPHHNCAGIAALATMRLLGIKSHGLDLSLSKGLPLGSGLGSSAASAAAATLAVNALFGSPLSPLDLVPAALKAEAHVSGYHADNVAPALLGGFILIESYDPLRLIDLPFPINKDLFFVLVSPEFEAPTKKMRAVLPSEVAMKDHVKNSSQAAAFVAAVLRGDVEGVGRALSADGIVEPRRAPLIPGMVAVKKAALEAGAFGCTISGAGPTAVAVVPDKEKGKQVGERMAEAFLKDGGLKSMATVATLDRVGARVITTSSQ